MNHLTLAFLCAALVSLDASLRLPVAQGQVPSSMSRAGEAGRRTGDSSRSGRHEDDGSHKGHSPAATNFWQTTGNAGTSPATQFLGTSDNQPLEIKVNNQRALRLEYVESLLYEPPVRTINLVGGYGGNVVSNGFIGGTIGGGGSADAENRIGGDFGTVGGGAGNMAGLGATVGGGSYNTAAGDENTTVAGGLINRAFGFCATIGGGYGNQATGQSVTIGGGTGNTASGILATVPGGYGNAATNYAFAAGRSARANHEGAFVWADGSGADPFLPITFNSTAPNEFAVRATGGVRLVSAIDSNGAATAGVVLAPGSGAWSSLSDRNAKENFTPSDAREILDKVAALPLPSWNYKAQGAAVRHLGPTAQDFNAAFGLGESDRTISTVDADGVALAAIQGLNQKLAEELKRRDGQNAELQRRLAQLEQLVSKLGRK